MIRRLVLLLILVAAAAAGFVYWATSTPYQGFGKEVFVDIPPGTTTSSMARMLTDAGVVESEWRFLLARVFNRRASLQAGEYRFDRPLSARDVLRKIASGDVFFHVLTIPEGANQWDIAEAVGKLGVMKPEAFLRAARDPSPIRDLAPNAPSLEGYLFPSTYRLTRRTTPSQLAREMTAQFRKVWKRIAPPGADVVQVVTLASLVEKETGVPAERRTVASVYRNRLDLGMKLDCDPTTVYAAMLQGTWRGTIYRSDLDSPHPYNTYRNAGLPPGPIASPGEEALKAALDPAATRFLFFVAKGDGSGAHVFSESLEQHQAAVRDYRATLAR